MRRIEKSVRGAVIFAILYSLVCISTVRVFADYDHLDKSGLSKTVYWNTSYDDGKYTNYRLPSIVVTLENTVIVYGEARNTEKNVDGGNQDECEMDLYIRRSTDGGVTFGDPIYIARGSEYLEKGLGETLNNPVMIVGNDGKLHFLFSCDVGKAGIFYTSSTDDGITWNEPENIVEQFSGVSWSMFAFGPGHGVCLDNGRLISSAWLYNGAYYVYPVYSDDNGQTWRIGQRVNNNRDETCIARLSDGGVLFNSRQNTYPSETSPYRVLSSSLTGIGAWTTSEAHTSLVDPACCGGMTSVELEGLPHAILFSNNASATARNNLTVKCSFDDGLTWGKSILIDKNNGGYSDIAVDKNGRVYVIYENSMGKTVMLAVFSYYETFCAGDNAVKSQQTDWTDVASLADKTAGVRCEETPEGILKATVENADLPSFTLNISELSKAVNVTDLPVLALRVRSSGGGESNSAGIFFRCGRNNESVSKLYTSFEVPNDGEEHTVFIDLRDRAAYRGNLLSIEIECYTMDAPAETGDTLEILRLGFYSSEEDALGVYPPADIPEETTAEAVSTGQVSTAADTALGSVKKGCASAISAMPLAIIAVPVAFIIRKRHRK